MVARRTTWHDVGLKATTVSEGATGVNIALDGTLSVADVQGLTLTRTLGNLYFMSMTVAGAWGIQALSFGIGISSREAFTAGVLPDPEGDTEEPLNGWVIRNVVAVAQNGIGGAVIQRVHFDIRAQRRLDSGRLYLRMVNTDVRGTGFTVGVVGQIRTLFKLP